MLYPAKEWRIILLWVKVWTYERQEEHSKLSNGVFQSTVGDYIQVCEDTLHARESGWALNEALGSSTMQFCASFPQSEVAADLLFLHSLCLEIIRPNKPCHLRGSFHQVPCGHAIMPCQLIIRSFGGGVRDVSQASAQKPFSF